MAKTKQNTIKSIEVLKTYYQPGGHGVMLTEQMRKFPAYRLLTSSQKVIFFDLMAHIKYRLMYEEPRTIEKKPFSYTYTDCKEDVSISTFKEAMLVLHDLGFVRRADEYKNPMKVAAPNQYVVSKAWQTFAPSEEQAARLAKETNARAKTISRQSDSKAAYIARVSAAAASAR